MGQNDLEVLLVSGRGEKNYWVLPGGGVEKEESSEEAVLREFMEEAGIKGSIDAVLGEFTVSKLLRLKQKLIILFP